MSRLAALGAELSGYVESARSADRNIVLDGCPVYFGVVAVGIALTGYLSNAIIR